VSAPELIPELLADAARLRTHGVVVGKREQEMIGLRIRRAANVLDQLLVPPAEPIDWADRLGPVQPRYFAESMLLLLDAAEADRDRLLALGQRSELEAFSEETIRRAPTAADEFPKLANSDVTIILRELLASMDGRTRRRKGRR
jgi:hypothetical protein